MTFGGLPTRFEPAGASRGLALVAPGRAYSPAAPLLELARLALLQHDLTVQQIWWDSTTRGDEDAEVWVRRHVAAAHAQEDADHVLVIGKSLGTRADLLPLAYIKELTTLQDQVLAFPTAEAYARIESELGRTLTESFAEIDAEPIASASLGGTTCVTR